MTSIEELEATADAAVSNEEQAQRALKDAQDARVSALQAYNRVLGEAAGLVVGETIVEVPSRYSWDRKLGKTEFLAVVDYSGVKKGVGLGRVVTNANKLHRGQYHRVSFEIGKAKDTGRRLVK